MRASVWRCSGSVFCGGTGHRDFRRQNRPGQSDSENGVLKTGFGKRGFGKRDSEKRESEKRDSEKRDSEKRDSENGIRKIYVEKSAVRLSVCLAGQGRGQGRAAGQGPNKEYKIRKNKTYKTSQWPKVTGTHGGLHSGLRPRAPTSLTELLPINVFT